jgi:hypothetical protein
MWSSFDCTALRPALCFLYYSTSSWSGCVKVAVNFWWDPNRLMHGENLGHGMTNYNACRVKKRGFWWADIVALPPLLPARICLFAQRCFPSCSGKKLVGLSFMRLNFSAYTRTFELTRFELEPELRKRRVHLIGKLGLSWPARVVKLSVMVQVYV